MTTHDEKYQIMIFAILLLASILSSGCGKNPSIEVASEVRPYYDSFMDAAARNGLSPNMDITIKMQDNGNSGIDALCAMGTGKITINSYHWDRLYDDEREALIFHEMGHCFLGREHIGTVVSGNPTYPTSIMYPYTLRPGVLPEHQEYYEKELFSYGQDCKKVGC